MKSNAIIIIISAAFLAILAISCANQTTPGGGPVDKTPPEVAASFPENGQVNVNPRTQISVRFSEWINTGSAQRAVSVFPPPPQGVTVKAAKDRITITPKEPLKENTTYHVTIGAALQDLRGNAAAFPVKIVFSTGAELDSGRLEGKIVPLERLAAAPRVALFWEDDDWNDAKYFTAPGYAVQSDSAGAFDFTHLRAGRYRVVAFADRYRTGRLHAGDTCFTSLERTITVTNEPQSIRLYPALSDTAKVSVVDSTNVDSTVADTVTAEPAITVDVDTLVKDTTITDTATIDTSVIDTIITDTTITDTTATRAKRSEKICYRLSGGADCLKPDEKRKWTYRPQGRGETKTFTVRDSAGTFSFDSIPASKGTLLWFIDNDGNDSITFGNLIPWRAPERFFIVPGEVEAKAGWEVVDLKVEACEEQEPQRPSNDFDP